MRSRHSRIFPGQEREGSNGGTSRSAFDVEAIRALALVLSETGLTEIEIADKDARVRLVRAPAPLPAAASPATGAGTAATVLLSPPAASAETSESDDAAHPGAVLSPMVGIVYLSPEPGAPLFVQPGQAVAPGQTLMLIEAMKTFNQIKAPKAGTLARILVSSGTPVEYGEVLAVVE